VVWSAECERCRCNEAVGGTGSSARGGVYPAFRRGFGLSRSPSLDSHENWVNKAIVSGHGNSVSIIHVRVVS
jgi:hypothetical protein